jgi:predicted HicB family RNase H-like nuclease
LGISLPVMPKQSNTPTQPKRGRPATGRNKIKLSASASPTLIAAAAKAAAKRGESFSSYVARAIQTQLLEER